MSEAPSSPEVPVRPDDVGRPPPARTPECDLERRRRFLKLAAGAGAVGLGLDRLSGLLHAQKGTGQGQGPCTTTVTYSKTHSESEGRPSGQSLSWSGTGTCIEGPGGSQTYPNSWSASGSGHGVGPASTYTMGYTQECAWPGTNTLVEGDCNGGTNSFTYSHPSYPSYTTSYSSSESGTKTVTCGGNVFEPPALGGGSRPAALPATLEAERAALQFPARTRVMRERHLALFGRYPGES